MSGYGSVMVRVTYLGKKEELSGDASADSSLLLVNGSGTSYLTAPQFTDPVRVWSRYEGFQVPYKTHDGWHVCKTVHGFFPSTGNVSNIMRDGRAYKVFYANAASLAYTLLPDDVLSVTTTGTFDSLKLILDCRAIYDFDSHGRFYTHEEIGDVLLIRYEKHAADTIESPLQTLPESPGTPYRLFVAIHTSDAHVLKKSIKQWFASNAKLDGERGSSPTTLYLYHALDFFVSKPARILIASGTNRDDVLSRLKNTVENHDPLVRTLAQYANALSEHDIWSASDVRANNGKNEYALVPFAFSQAQLGLDSLFVKPRPVGVEGIYAGLPWFFQFWTRDEAISLGGLLSQKKYKDVKSLLQRQLTGMLSDGRLSNRYPLSLLGSADGIGWCAKRWHDLLVAATKDRTLSDLLTDKELIVLRDTFISSYTLLAKNYCKGAGQLNGLISNTALETWMDTSANGVDVRDGYCIEIQALLLVQLRLINLLCSLVGNGTTGSYQQAEELLSKKVASLFFVDGALADRLTVDGKLDKTARPNVFIAHYVYPWLLSSKQWESAFDAALKELWLGWGGLSSISTQHPLFCPNYTGENNLSYHRGDSWYFLNNIAAICLHRVHSAKYKQTVDALIAAASYDILWHGSLGFSSEVSNARKQSASACTAQAWSMATYIELILLRFSKQDFKT